VSLAGGQPWLDNLEHTFERLIVVRGNEVALRRAHAFAAASDPHRSPLFLFGDSGVGKTHLIHAVALAIAAGNSSLRLRMWSAEEYTNALVAAIQRRDAPGFRRTCLESDVLFLDNVEHFRGKEAMQEEVLLMVTELHRRGAGVMLAASCAPSSIPRLAHQLADLPGYQAVSVDSPDTEELEAIATERAAAGDAWALPISSFVARLVAHGTRSPREIDAMFRRIRLFATLRGLPASPAVAAAALKTPASA
jgi:chromosomal replication initiator protein